MIPQYIPTYNREDIAREINRYVLGNNYFSENLQTKEFEDRICYFLGIKHCITVNNGTMSLVLALLANRIKKDDYVLIPNITMMSTQSAIDLIGVNPIFVDINELGLVDLNKARVKIEQPNNRIKAIILVTLNGRSYDINEYKEFCDFCLKNDVKIIEDNCQSFGSKWSDHRKISCSFNNIGCFSTSFHKLLPTGQGGFCITNNDELAIKLRQLKNVGRLSGGNDIHEHFGINSKFTDIQAIIGSVGLRNIKEKIEGKRGIYQTYYEKLENIPEIKMIKLETYETPWFIDIYTEYRDELFEFLKANNIGTRKIYSQLSEQPINEKYNNQPFPISQQLSKTGLWLPSSLTLTENEINDVCEKISLFYKHNQNLKEMREEYGK